MSSPLLAGDGGEPNVPMLPCRTTVSDRAAEARGICRTLPYLLLSQSQVAASLHLAASAFGILGAFTAEVRDAGAKLVVKIHR